MEEEEVNLLAFCRSPFTFLPISMRSISTFVFLWVCLAGGSLAQGDFVVAEPQSGEGVLGFLYRHEVPAKEYKDAFLQLNKGKMGRQQSLLAGVAYKIDKRWIAKKEAEWRDYPIFGESYRKLEVIDDLLDGAIFYLIAGHGGPDPGAVGSLGSQQLCEDEYAYDVTLRLARWLIERGGLVYLITRDDNDGIRDAEYLPCDKDEYAYLKGAIPARHLSRLKQRTGLVNSISRKYAKSRYQRMVSIHIDSRSRGEQVDVFFYYHHKSSTGRALATDVQKTFEENYREHQPNRGYKGAVLPSNSLYVLRSTRPPAILIELGNISSARDRQRIMIPDNRQALAHWMGEGLLYNYQASQK
ncbi:MAG: N-acetylmuramoyl-L-alanine amidase [Bacteroidota bacterium]